MAPSTSAWSRFWLSLRLASMRSITSSMPTIALSCLAMKSAGASSTDHLFGSVPLVVVGEPADQVELPRVVVVDGEPPVDEHALVVPRRDDPAVLALRRIPRRRHVGVRSGEDRQRLGSSAVRHIGFARATCPMSEPGASSPCPTQSNGTVVASSPLIGARDQVGDRGGLDHPADHVGPIFGERLGHVHASSVPPAAATTRSLGGRAFEVLDS